MTNNRQAKQHKVIHKIITRVSAIERVASLASTLLMCIGFVGFTITLFIDPIRGRNNEFSWLQVSGLFVFLGVLVSGSIINSIINNTKK